MIQIQSLKKEAIVARFPLWTPEEDELLRQRWEDVENFPTKVAVGKDFPNRTANSVEMRLKKLIDAKILLPRESIREEVVPVAEAVPTRPVLIRNSNKVALPFVSSLLIDGVKYSSGSIILCDA